MITEGLMCRLPGSFDISTPLTPRLLLSPSDQLTGWIGQPQHALVKTIDDRARGPVVVLFRKRSAHAVG